jgi:thioesterase domain-containing protein/acyl carrier protein
VVILREDAGREPLLAAYIVPKAGRDPAAAELRTLAARNLPSYMIPSVFMVIESLPLTANGKIDRRSLPTPVTQSEPGKPETSQPVPAARMRKPSSSGNKTEAKLIEIWEDILPVRPITPESDFFESGGHSLLAVRMLTRVEKTFGRKMNLATLFQASTIQELAIAIKGDADPAAISGIIPLQPEGTRPPLLCLHGIPSMALLSRELGPDQPFLMVHLPEGVQLDPPYTVEALAEIHVQTIRRFQSHGPYNLVGWCREGLLALEVAQQLEAQGENVELLTIFDAWLPQYMERFSPAETRRANWLLKIERIRLNLLQINEMGLLKAASFMPDKLWSGMINAIRHLKWRLRNRRPLAPGAEPERRSQDEMLFLAVDHYQAKKYDGRVLLVRSDKYRNWKYWDSRLWWGDFLPRLEMLEIPGIHDSMLTGPSLPRIARAMADAISQSQQSVKQTLTQGRTA